jgi:hypothetical protein
MIRITSSEGEHIWRIGDILPCVNEVKAVLATGDELCHIMQNFHSIPKANSSALLWKGEAAQFIVDNLMNFPSYVNP